MEIILLCTWHLTTWINFILLMINFIYLFSIFFAGIQIASNYTVLSYTFWCYIFLSLYQLCFLHVFSFKKCSFWSSYHGAAEMNLTGNHEVAGSIPGLAHWVKDPTWEPPYAGNLGTSVCCGCGPKKTKDKKKKKVHLVNVLFCWFFKD